MYDGPSLASRVSHDQATWASATDGADERLEYVTRLHASLDPNDIACVLAEHLLDRVPLAYWTIVATDLEGQPVMLVDPGLAPELMLPVLGVGYWVMHHDTPFLAGDLRRDDRVAGGPPFATMAFPLKGRDSLIGALVGLDPGVSAEPPVLTPAFAEALSHLAAPAALALDTALRIKRVEALSVTDDLTRLYNSRYLNIALRRETRLAARTHRPLSLLFIDLDGFKSINDNHGHLAGSRALVEAGVVIRGSARETDIVARFGGDEFALILPDTGGPGALQVAERIRDRIASHSFLAGDGLDIHLTASVGIATLPEVAAAADELVQAADAAMYRVKDRGKNGIQAAPPGR